MWNCLGFRYVYDRSRSLFILPKMHLDLMENLCLLRFPPLLLFLEFLRWFIGEPSFDVDWEDLSELFF